MGLFSIRALLAVGTLAAQGVLGQDCNYQASNIVTGSATITADLKLTGSCPQYPADPQGALLDLKLLVEYQTDNRLHVNIYDGGLNMYQIQESVIPRPTHKSSSSPKLKFNIVANPFSFSVVRVSNGEVLFDTTGMPALVFQSQYLRLGTKLPANPNLYGLGEHSDSFRLGTDNYHRTMWNAESPFLPRKQNLYGSHPMYIDHRGSRGTHGVLLLNANGMDINMGKDQQGRQYLEYNTIGGVLDLYFLEGPAPAEVSRQYATATGLAAMTPYWAFGFQHSKYGYDSAAKAADVVKKHRDAGIPLEVMWGDIDYMDGRRDFTVDPVRYPLATMRSFIADLHTRKQKYVMMLDPGINRNNNYAPYTRGKAAEAFHKAADGSDYRGKQWAGEVVWPDWFAPKTTAWWTDEIVRFFDPGTGLDVDGLWNDMNEASNFCYDMNCNPSSLQAQEVSDSSSTQSQRRHHRDLSPRQWQGQQRKGLPNRNLLQPRYRIANHRGDLSVATIYTNVTNRDDSVQYDTHNLYGMMMGAATRTALLKRRPGKRPFILSRSTHTGAGRHMAHWFGDNYSSWDDYRFSIQQMLTFAAVHNMPVVGSDVCGFHGDAQEQMCARWALLGAFQPFYRNHADISAPEQEFYKWPLVTTAAKKAIDARYRLLDYMYGELRRQSVDGTPMVSPMFFHWPNDANTFDLQYQWMLGDALLVSPVNGDDSQTVSFYLPAGEVFYDFWTLVPEKGQGALVRRDGVAWTDIPVHIRGGKIIPLRVKSAMTTAEVRQQNFEVWVAVGLDGKATGRLYLDDGESIDGSSSDLQLSYESGSLRITGTFGFKASVVLESVTVVKPDGTKTKKTGSWSLNESASIAI